MGHVIGGESANEYPDEPKLSNAERNPVEAIMPLNDVPHGSDESVPAVRLKSQVKASRNALGGMACGDFHISGFENAACMMA